MTRVSFQGEHGAYSEEAARRFFGGEAEMVPRPSFAEALEQTVSSRTDHTILPVENSIEGSVGESYGLLYTTPLKVTGETHYSIRHCLIGSGGLGDVDTVYSHPQALGQCRGFLQRHRMRTIPAYDTAGSVMIVKKLGRRSAACIASRSAAEAYGLPVIRVDIADNPDNVTRFLIMSRSARAAGGPCKTSIVFSVRHEPGSLYRVLEILRDHGVNMTKIESRPKRRMRWEYNFFVDFEGDPAPEMLEQIRDGTTLLRVLGTYPVDP